MAASSESDRQGAPDGEESQEVSSQTSSRGLDELPFNSEYNNRLVISYEGTEYCGWQLQREGVKTIQGELEAVLMKVLKEDRVTLAVQAAGRTDAGVHARHQVAHFRTKREVADEARLQASLNGLLPPDIRVLEMRRANKYFHSRYSSLGKIYHYHINNRLVRDPFCRRLALHVRHELDVQALMDGAQRFVGTHDFAAFRNMTSDSKSKQKGTVRTIYRFDVVEEPYGIRLEVEGNGFLYKYGLVPLARSL